MDMISRTLGVLCFTIALSGCTTLYPLPIKEPKTLNEEGNPLTLSDYLRERTGLLPGKNTQASLDNMLIYSDTYLNYSDELRRNEYKSNDMSILGGIVSVIGGVTKSASTAISGAVFSSGSALVTKRYQTLIQAENYEKASDAMYCLYSKLQPLQDPNVFPFTYANDKIDEVRRKLRKSQGNVQLASPDLDALQKSVGEYVKARENELVARQNVVRAGADNAVLSEAKFQLRISEIEVLKSQLDTCVASF